MADALASSSTSASLSSRPDPIGLVQRALSSNQALQDQLTKRADQLEAQIREADKLLDALENDANSEEAEDEVQIPGARRISSLFTMSECLDTESPFFEEANKRSEFAGRITAQSFNPKQLEALKNAVRSENQRLQAYNKQAGNQNVVDIDRNIEGVNWSVVAEKVSDAGNDKLTADQCRIKWVGDRHPRFNRSEWKNPETQRLNALVEAAMNSTERVSWLEITQKLGTDRTVADVLNHGCNRPRHQWDSHSDELLLQAVAKHGVNNWTIVAREVSKYVTPTQCQNRYNKSLDPSIKRGAWTGVEDERLKKAVAAFGSAWVRVAEYVPGRTNDQCHERWTWHQNSNASKNIWTDKEDRMLLELVGCHGRQWKAFSEKIGNGKTGPSCRIRFNKLTKVKESTPASSYIPGPASIDALSSAAATPREIDSQSSQLSSEGWSQAAPSTSTSATGQPKGRGRKRKTDSESVDRPSTKRKKTAAQLEEGRDSQIGHDVPSEGTSVAKSRPQPRRVAKRKTKGAETKSSIPQHTNYNTSRSETPPVETAQQESALAAEATTGPRRSARRSTRSEAQQ